MNESADAVYAIVSVPWITTNPSKPSLRSAISAASSRQWASVMLELSRLKATSVSISAIRAISGTWRSSWP